MRYFEVKTTDRVRQEVRKIESPIARKLVEHIIDRQAVLDMLSTDGCSNIEGAERIQIETLKRSYSSEIDVLAEIVCATDQKSFVAWERANRIEAIEAEQARRENLERMYNERGETTCDRCGGAGGWKGWPGYTCFKCAGRCSVPMTKRQQREYDRQRQQVA
jgi:hypothetical protein